jgi:hypothetical protein
MRRLCLAAFTTGAMLLADGFTFTIGSPVAARDVVAKTAAFVFRTEGCAQPEKAQISGTAEGLVKGTRRSVGLNVKAMSTPGVYAIYQGWPAEGDWVVNLKGTCASASAGAIIPIGPKGFIRESSRFFSRPPTDAEIEASLKTLGQGGNK